jgi:hypothetical protein
MRIRILATGGAVASECIVYFYIVSKDILIKFIIKIIIK